MRNVATDGMTGRGYRNLYGPISYRTAGGCCVCSREMKDGGNMKDWTGGYNSVFTTLGTKNNTTKEREENDFYATDPVAIDALILEGNVTLAPNVWECASGEGHLANRLKEHGYCVRATDLIDRGYGESGVDFLKTREVWDGDILTNPPYKFAQQFIEHALDILPQGRRVYMLLKLQFLEGKARKELFAKCPPRTVFVFSSRLLCAKNGDFEQIRANGGSAVAYAWYEFEKGYKGKTEIKWIH